MKKLSIILVTLMSLIFSTPYSFAANTSDLPAAPTDLEKIQHLRQELISLKNSLRSLQGNEQDIARLQLYKKNAERRDVLQKLFQSDEASKQDKAKMISDQIQFVKENKAYVINQLKQQKTDFETAENTQQLPLLNKISENNKLLLSFFEAEKENYDWALKLGIAKEANDLALKKEIKSLIDNTSAKLDYDVKNASDSEAQLKGANESEKPQIEHSSQVFERSVTINTAQLKGLIKIADKLGIDTTTYKQQLFESTGKITEDILNVNVAMSLVDKWKDQAINWFTNHALQGLFKILIFVAIILIGRFLANITRSLVKKAVAAPKLNLSMLMQDFFISMAGKFIFFIMLLIALAQIGLDLGPILTGFGIAGVIIGFALQDTLSNFASGLMLLIYRPFDVGDIIEAGGVSGKVHSLNLVSTTIYTFDNQIIIVPNSGIWGGTIVNLTKEKTRRVDMTFGIGYDDDIRHAEKVLNEIISKHEKVLKSPQPTIKLHNLNDSSVDFIVRPWAKTEDYWAVYWDITREVKLRFDEEKISIPYPQSDVHLHMIKSDDS